MALWQFASSHQSRSSSITCHGPCRVMEFSMMTSSNGNIFRVTGHLCGEFTGPRWIPRTKASDAELWCFLSSASESTVCEAGDLIKQLWGWWFETLSCPLWRHCNSLCLLIQSKIVRMLCYKCFCFFCAEFSAKCLCPFPIYWPQFQLTREVVDLRPSVMARD